MKYTLKYKIKALVLLSVFSLNTAIGFACSVGIDMGFNSKHHQDEIKPEIHTHANGKKHVHDHSKPGHQNKHHDGGNDKDNCCNDQVMKIQQIDKSVPNFVQFIHPAFSSIFITYLNYDVFCPIGVPKDIKQFVRSYHPPIPNIYIAVQSFLI